MLSAHDTRRVWQTGNADIPVTMIAERAAERITRNRTEAKHPTIVFRSPDDQTVPGTYLG